MKDILISLLFDEVEVDEKVEEIEVVDELDELFVKKR